MAKSPTPKWLVVLIAREQGGIPPPRAICPYCCQPGATDPHHWAYKGSDNIPNDIVHMPENVVLLCHECHDRYGQTKAMTMKCLAHKLGLGYDIYGWIDRLIESGRVKHRPDIYGGDHETVVESKQERID